MMFQTRSPLNLLHGTPTGLAVLPDGESEIALPRLAAIKRAAIVAAIRKRIRALNSQSEQTGGRKNG